MKTDNRLMIKFLDALQKGKRMEAINLIQRMEGEQREKARAAFLAKYPA